MRTQTRHPRPQRKAFGRGFAHAGSGAGFVDAQQQLAGFHLHWPSRTRISATTPPSSDCTTCNWRDGTTRPSPRVISSTRANADHTSSTSSTTPHTRTMRWARCVFRRDITTCTSRSKVSMPLVAVVVGGVCRTPRRSAVWPTLRTRSPRRHRRWGSAQLEASHRRFAVPSSLEPLGRRVRRPIPQGDRGPAWGGPALGPRWCSVHRCLTPPWQCARFAALP